MGIISGTTNIKMILSFLPGIGWHFIGNTHYRSDDPVMQLIPFCHFYHKQCLLQILRRKNPEKSNLGKEGARDCPPPFFLSND
jgi:hypothetical protein